MRWKKKSLKYYVCHIQYGYLKEQFDERLKNYGVCLPSQL